ncbi:uncharacterized protein LOC122020850 [Zingiber officinale]|uniref:Uncharacterized protein n=1 Tax=Zingiber officinale TaxID=94328 RepID=A0A8J5F6R3_ZINOF|nr:uncharacterized protein LOC122020850 [Zingiber officinale]KAG6480098.1 hypothetical protein ZIOFF_063576 [Zingiber officinale]
MATFKIQSCVLLLLLVSALTLSSADSPGSEQPSAYEMLEKFDFPKGILPEGVQSYELKGDGSFTVFLAGDCKFKVDGGYVLKYGRKITGKVEAGALTNLNGVSVKILFAWFSIGSVARSDAALNFYVGPLSASFPVSNFEECPSCSCGFDCATAAAALSAES